MALTQVQGGMILPSTTLTTPIVATTMGVGGATPSTSGAGITFPATQSASSDANTLDDYEEGTWTPSFTGLGTVTLNYARYTRIGNMVTAWANFIVTTTPTKNNSTFTLPFTPNTFGGGTYSRGTVEGGILEPQQSDPKCYWATDPTSSASAFYTMVVFRVA